MSKQVEHPLSNLESPEQLLRMLELQRAGHRQAEAAASTRRWLVLGGGLMVIISGALVALFFLFLQLSPQADCEQESPIVVATQQP